MIDRVINDTEDALRAVAKLVEPCRVDKVTKNSIRFGHRVMWVFRDNPSVRDKHQKLQICHQSLTVVFTCLYSKDVIVIAPAPEGGREEQPPPYDPQLKELLDWQNRRKGRKGLGERESPTSDDLGLAKSRSTELPATGASGSCLLAIPLGDDDKAASLSTLFSEMSSVSASMHTPEVQLSVSHKDDISLSPATTSPESNSRSPDISAHEPRSYGEIESSPPPKHTNPNDYIGPTHNLPEIDSPDFGAMIAPYTFNNDKREIIKVNGELPTHEFFSAWDRKTSSSAVTAFVGPSDSTSSSTPPFSPATMPISSNANDGFEPGLKWLESPRHNSYGHQEHKEAPSPAQHPLPVRCNSDVTIYQSDRLDALARAEDVMIRENKAVGAGQASVKRGGRSWLAYHATRSDMGNGIGWDG